MPNEPNEYTREGTALHALSAHCLESGQDAAEWLDRAFKYDDHGETLTIEIDDEQAEAVQVYLDVVRSDKDTRGGKLLVETRFHLNWLHKEFFGTGDCCTIGTDNILRVYDAKFGKGKPVEIRRPDGKPNSQLGYYGIGAVEALRRVIEQLKVDKVELVVVQPRRHHCDGFVRRITVTHAELMELSQDLVEAADNALSDNPRFQPGEHCGFCLGAARCRALRDFAFSTAQLEFDDEEGRPIVKLDPLKLEPTQIANVLDAADVLDAWIGAVRLRGFQLANAGDDIPGYKLVANRATRKWRDEAKAASDLSLVFGLDDKSIFRQKLLTPAQAEAELKKAKLLKTQEAKDALTALYDKTSSGKKLARLEDEREARPAQVQVDFDDGASASVDW